MNGAIGLGSAGLRQCAPMTQVLTARFRLGQPVRHRDGAFAGVVVDVDPRYAGHPSDLPSDEAEQPFYRVLSTEGEGRFVAYAAEHVLEADRQMTNAAGLVREGWLRAEGRGRLTPGAHRLH